MPNGERKRKTENRKPLTQNASVIVLSWLFTVLCFAFPWPCRAASPQVFLSTQTLEPGQTLRVEVDHVVPDAKLRVSFRGKLYPCFVVGPDAQRALIGIPLGTEPGSIPLEIRPTDPNAKPLTSEPEIVTISSKTYVIENINLPPAKTKLVGREHGESALIHKRAMILRSQQYWEGSFQPPVTGAVIAPFGLRRMHNGKTEAGFHNGVDLRAPKGTPVLAANAGVVELAASFRAHGKTILLNHGQGVTSVYLHMSSLLVKPGQRVRKGQKIGRVGSTGVSTAPHVHWQIFVHGVQVDPQQWLETEF